jgi:aminoglycoside phosphotransferase (APT) family kinase protein
MSAVDRPALPDGAPAALHAVFGDAPIEELEIMRGGQSGATLLSFKVDGAGYVLRKSAAGRALREIACMQIAADRGVAPRLHHADQETAITIMDRVAGAPLGRSATRDPRRIEQCATTLRRLHDGPAFPPSAPLLDMLRFLEAPMIARTGAGLPAELFRTIEGVMPCLARYANTAPCHHDLHPNNVLEAEGRIFFVDWEIAGAGDPFIDLVQLGFAFPAREDREALLETYLGHRPDEEERARETVARVVVLAFYAAAFFHVRSRSGATGPVAEPVPLAEAMRTFATSGERADIGLVASSFLFEMKQQCAADAFESSKARLMRF